MAVGTEEVADGGTKVGRVRCVARAGGAADCSARSPAQDVSRRGSEPMARAGLPAATVTVPTGSPSTSKAVISTRSRPARTRPLEAELIELPWSLEGPSGRSLAARSLLRRSTDEAVVDEATERARAVSVDSPVRVRGGQASRLREEISGESISSILWPLLGDVSVRAAMNATNGCGAQPRRRGLRVLGALYGGARRRRTPIFVLVCGISAGVRTGRRHGSSSGEITKFDSSI